MYWDQAAGTLWLEIPRLDQEVLYVSGLSAGVGSNDIGLDRGQLGGRAARRFQRVGPQGAAWCSRTPRYRAAAAAPTRSAPSRSRSRRRCSGASRSPRRRAGACWWMRPTSCCAMRTAWSSGLQPRGLPPRPNAQRGLPAAHQGLPEEHRDGGDPHLHRPRAARPGRAAGSRRAPWAPSRPRADAVTVRQHHSLVELPGPGFVPRAIRPARRVRRLLLRRLLRAARPADRRSASSGGTGWRRRTRPRR